MYFHRYIFYVLQDLKVNMNIVLSVLGFIALLMIAATVPGNMTTLLVWHSTKEFVLIFRYEFLYVSSFLLLLGSLYRENDWFILRRYNHREQIGTNKVITVIMISGLFTLVIMTLGMICSSIVKYVIYPNINHYTAIFLYVPEVIHKGSFGYFVCIFFLVTTIIGLIFMLLVDILKNKILSASILITFIILDRFTISLIPYFMYNSETTSPIGTFIILLCTLILLINAVHFKSNRINYFAQDENV